MNTINALVAARAVISNSANWCRRARTDLYGRHCALGAFEEALCHEQAEIDDHPAIIALGDVARKMDPNMPNYDVRSFDVAHFNNTHTHAELMQAFDIAIANEKAKCTLLQLKVGLRKSAKEYELA